MGGAEAEPPEEVVEFVLSARYGDLEDVEAMLASKACPVDAQSHGGSTALLMGSANGHVEVVRALLAAEASTEVPNEAGNRPLHWGALNGHMEARSNVNAKNEFGRTPFEEAFGRSMSEVCELLAKSVHEFAPEPGEDEHCAAEEEEEAKETTEEAPAAEEKPAPAAEWKKGDTAQLVGLQAAPELNGLTCRLTGFNKERGGWTVEVRVKGQKSTKQVRPVNLARPEATSAAAAKSSGTAAPKPEDSPAAAAPKQEGSPAVAAAIAEATTAASAEST